MVGAIQEGNSSKLYTTDWKFARLPGAKPVFGVSTRTGVDLQNRIQFPKRIGRGLARVRIWYPGPVHHQAVFVPSWWQSEVLPPIAPAQPNHLSRVRPPLVECARD